MRTYDLSGCFGVEQNSIVEWLEQGSKRWCAVLDWGVMSGGGRW